jgi:mannose-6-phosphate isomerase-like protein (cupin superfamily)
MQKVNILEKFSLFDDQWNPRIIGELNDQMIKIARIQGEFVWHSHAKEDEFFLVLKGAMKIRLRDQVILLNEGDFFIVPHGVEHKPVADREAWILMFEPASTSHTGDVQSDITVDEFERI